MNKYKNIYLIQGVFNSLENSKKSGFIKCPDFP